LFAVQREQPAVFTVTEAAAERVREILQKQAKPNAFLRVRIVAGGCSGLQYKLEFTENQRKDDNVIESNGVRVLIDPKSVVFLAGSRLEYSEELIGGGFRVTNPHAKAKCSCGESFTV